MIDEAMLLREAAYNLSGQDPQETKAVMQGAASKIDELRSMLAERDAEIGLLNSTLESRNRNIETLSEVSTARRKALTECDAEINGWKADQKENLANQCELQAIINDQRKVLEQAQAALQYSLFYHSDKSNAIGQAAIAAILEVLK